MIQQTKRKLFHLGLLRPKLVVLILGIIVACSVIAAENLKIDTDPIDLLPQSTQSVRDINKLKYYFGANNFVMITLEASDPQLSGQFADKFIEHIQGLPEIINIDFRRPVEFFKERQWLYLEKEDLIEIESRIDRALALESKGISLVFNDYMDFADASEKPDLTFKDIFDKYKKKPWVPKKVGISSDEGRFQVIRIKVNNETSQYENAKQFLKKIQEVASEIQKSNGEYSKVNVGYTGPMINRVDQADSIKKEIALVAVIVATALVLILFLYFRNFESIFIIGIPLLSGILITGGLIALFLGHLNLITSFAAGIIAGLGSDYGIYLLNRYYQERGAGKSFEESCHLAFANTGSATFGSMLTTVGAFVALLFSKFGFFFEFGVAGALGILINYLAMMLLIPAMLALLHDGNKAASLNLKSPFRIQYDTFDQKLKTRFNKIFTKRPLLHIVVVLFLAGFSLLVIPQQAQIYYAEGLMENKDLPSKKLLDKVGDAVKESLNPTVFIAPDGNEERKTVDVLMNLLKTQPDQQVFNNVIGLSNFITHDAESKKNIIKNIYAKMSQIRWLPKEKRQQYLSTLESSMKAEAVTADNLPHKIRSFFDSPLDEKVKAVYVYPAFGRNNNESLKKYHEGILSLVSENNLNVVPVDTNFAGNDIIKLIRKESPRGLAMIFSFLAAVFFFISKSGRRTVIVILCLVGSLVILSGILWLLDLQMNVLNIVALPIILGTGIDSFVHFAQHYDEHKDIILSVREKMPAIAVSNLTSIVGFAGLLFTSYSGLRSLGYVVVLGLFVVTLICIFLFPRCLIVGSSKSSAM